jgi:phage replication-related protein YjqB (UPF0714/DUF867 family)
MMAQRLTSYLDLDDNHVLWSGDEKRKEQEIAEAFRRAGYSDEYEPPMAVELDKQRLSLARTTRHRRRSRLATRIKLVRKKEERDDEAAAEAMAKKIADEHLEDLTRAAQRVAATAYLDFDENHVLWSECEKAKEQKIEEAFRREGYSDEYEPPRAVELDRLRLRLARTACKKRRARLARRLEAVRNGRAMVVKKARAREVAASAASVLMAL